MTTTEKPHMPGSRDPRSGDLYAVPRLWSVDGGLVELEPAHIPAVGVLTEVIEMGPRSFGYVDLSGGVRVITELGAGPHDVGGRYQLSIDAQPRRFDRA
ncbi:hypothetical protein I1A62_03535 (plasmid) [Rhodococcus sp. USK10]|uniref:hypothetical protein n=1 Tax=Rhodococcus sp. USK10 TaxID=2789739 RepID=UPI001C5F479F|nr:hypothetical protein [Rhodococcus sp. USK10]QYB00172.1 hypothetical protein I1A62_03535 [Rhodococcus sp. USK10]